jgi:hypothetical protein
MAHPTVVPVILVCLAVMFLPCLTNFLQRFLQKCITIISQATAGEQFKAIMLLQTLQARQLPHITPSQQEVARRQAAPLCHLCMHVYIRVYTYIYMYLCVYVYIHIYIKEPGMLECQESLRQFNAGM